MKNTLFILMFLLAFTRINAQTNIANFEAWHNASVIGQLATFPVPNGWSGTDSLFGLAGTFLGNGTQCLPGIAKETPGNGGSGTAMKVMTVNQPAIDTTFPAGATPTLVSSAKLDIDQTTFDFNYIGGIPLNYVPYSVSMWVKNNVVQTDSTQIEIVSVEGDDNLTVAVADTLLWNNLTSYTKITLPMKWVDSLIVPSHLRINISSNSNGSDTAFAGTYIIVDDISVNFPNGVSQYLYSSNVAMVYPTEMTNTLQVNLNVGNKEVLDFYLYDINGRLVKRITGLETLNKIDVSALKSGLYTYQIIHNRKVQQLGKLVKD